MSNVKILPQKRWTSAEIEFLAKTVKDLPSKHEAFVIVCSKTERTYKAVEQFYNRRLGSKPTKKVTYKIEKAQSWKSFEIDILKDAVDERTSDTSLSEVFTKVAQKLKKSPNAVRIFYKRHLTTKTKGYKSVKETKSGVPLVMYHNGVTHQATVILQKPGLIVAKVKDVVITIEL